MVKNLACNERPNVSEALLNFMLNAKYVLSYHCSQTTVLTLSVRIYSFNC